MRLSFRARDFKESVLAIGKVILEAGLAITSSAVLLVPFVKQFLISPRSSGINITVVDWLSFGGNLQALDRKVIMVVILI